MVRLNTDYTFKSGLFVQFRLNHNTGTDGALGGYSGSWRFYSTGYGMIGRYTQWRLCEDSMAIWDTLASMCIDSLEKYHANIGNPTGYEPGFGMYRLMDGDSGYTSGMGKNHAFVGLQLLYNRLDDDYAFTGGNSTAKTHYSYLWGSYDFPYSVDYYLDKAPDLDVVGPGAYIFSSNDNSVVQEGLDSIISRCRRYVRPINARGKVYMPLVQCGIIFSSGCRPTLKQLRAASWVVLTHGSAWLGYYYYRGWSSVYPGVVDGTRRPYVMNYGDLNTALNTNIWDDENTNIADNGWLNLYTVIKEIKQIGPTLGNLTWVDGFGKKSSTTELPRGWVKAATGANRIEFGMFTHDESGEQYLMVVNCDCAESDDGVKDITLTLTPGPGTYSIKNVATDQTIYSNSTNSNGELTNVLIEDVSAGGGVLLQLQRSSKTEDITSDDLFATEGSNGRHIVADDFGGLHVVYISNGNVYYAYKNSGEATLSGWSKQLVVTGANYSSLALDDYGNPYIAYHKSNKTYVTNLVKTLEVGFGNSSGPTSIAVNSECRSFCVGAVYGGEVIFGMFDWITFQRLGYYMDLGPGSYPTVTSGTVEVKNSPYHGKPCYFVAKESKGKITVNSFLADGSSCWIGSFITFNGSLPSYDWDGQTSVLIYVDGSTAKCRRGSNNYATAETVGNNGGYIQSDKGLFAAWKNHPIHGIEGAYFKDGTWTQDNILASSYGLNSICSVSAVIGQVVRE